ncbi:MAG TPA: rRNA maturation RNase YbeY [Methyloceanibacter sp.]|jgi:probable rRNA maturation factor|nr:rRNA maturation RNase YbeY [Methyloceanibacter sp.]
MADGGPSRKVAAATGATLELDVVRHGGAWKASGLTDVKLKQAARAAIRATAALPRGRYQATLLLTDDHEMRELNRTWRGKDAATNVLSFPAEEKIAEPGFLGDVVLAYETTAKEAREQGITLQDHIAHLVVHGVLHLLGFDHTQDEEAERMESVERRALASLGIADPYAHEKADFAEVSR